MKLTKHWVGVFIISSMFATTAANAKNLGEFICENIQTLNVTDKGKVLDDNLALDTDQTKFLIEETLITRVYPADGGDFSLKHEFSGNWRISENGTHQFLLDGYDGGIGINSIQWTKYGLGTFRKYAVNRTRVTLYNCMKLK